MDGTPHGYIGKSWRLKEAWAPLPPLGARSSLMAMGPNLSNLHAWMHVRVQMTMHVPRSGSYFSSRRDTKCVHLLLTYAAHVKFFDNTLQVLYVQVQMSTVHAWYWKWRIVFG